MFTCTNATVRQSAEEFHVAMLAELIPVSVAVPFVSGNKENRRQHQDNAMFSHKKRFQ